MSANPQLVTAPLKDEPDTLWQARMKLGIIGDSPAFETALRMLPVALKTRKPIILQGRVGTGRRSFARLIHELCGNTLFQEISAPDTVDLFMHAVQTGDVPPCKRTIYISNAQNLAVAHVRSALNSARQLESTTLVFGFTLESDLMPDNVHSLLDVLRESIRIAIPSLAERPGDAALLCRHWLKQHSEGETSWTTDCDEIAFEAEIQTWEANVRSLKMFCSLSEYLPISSLAYAIKARQFTTLNYDSEPLTLMEGYSMESYFSKLRKKLMDRTLRSSNSSRRGLPTMQGSQQKKRLTHKSAQLHDLFTEDALHGRASDRK